MTFLPGPSARRHLTQPTQDQVDLRAACFCHRKIVDIGYVCSVCLSSKSLALERFGGSIVPLTRRPRNSKNRKQSSAPQSPFAPPVGMSLTSPLPESSSLAFADRGPPARAQDQIPHGHAQTTGLWRQAARGWCERSTKSEEAEGSGCGGNSEWGWDARTGDAGLSFEGREAVYRWEKRVVILPRVVS